MVEGAANELAQQRLAALKEEDELLKAQGGEGSQNGLTTQAPPRPSRPAQSKKSYSSLVPERTPPSPTSLLEKANKGGNEKKL